MYNVIQKLAHNVSKTGLEKDKEIFLLTIYKNYMKNINNG